LGAWATAALPWFQIVGTFATAIAAIAAWRSANAASLTADRADRTAQRTAETLGMSKRPNLRVNVKVGCKPTEPDVGTLFITNSSDLHPGIVTAARVERPDGRPTAVASGLPVTIKQRGRDGQAIIRDLTAVGLGPFPPLTPDAHPGDGPSELPMTYELEFSDMAGLVTWWQTGKLREDIRFERRTGEGPDAERPVYSYVELDDARSEPEVIYGAASAELRCPPGMIRRAAAAISRGVGRVWRWVW